MCNNLSGDKGFIDGSHRARKKETENAYTAVNSKYIFWLMMTVVILLQYNAFNQNEDYSK